MGDSQLTKSLALVSYSLANLKPPTSYFAGRELKKGITPDNIILFKRLNTQAFKPSAISDNYHHRFELLVVLQKEGLIRVDHERLMLQPLNALLIFPHQFHHYMDVEDEGAMEWLFITFELAHREAEEILTPLKDIPRRLNARVLQLLQTLVETYCAPPAPTTALSLSLTLAKILNTLLEAPAVPSSVVSNTKTITSPKEEVLEKINAYIRTHLSEPLTLEQIGMALGYSASYLRSLFKTEFGVSLGRYIRESRLSEAALLLQSGEGNIAEIAKRAGFESPFSFSRAFKNTYGVPPKSYCKWLQKNHQH